MYVISLEKNLLIRKKINRKFMFLILLKKKNLSGLERRLIG